MSQHGEEFVLTAENFSEKCGWCKEDFWTCCSCPSRFANGCLDPRWHNYRRLPQRAYSPVSGRENDNCPICNVNRESAKMICCDECKRWFHCVECINMDEESIEYIDSYYCLDCLNCEQNNGQSVSTGNLSQNSRAPDEAKPVRRTTKKAKMLSSPRPNIKLKLKIRRSTGGENSFKTMKSSSSSAIRNEAVMPLHGVESSVAGSAESHNDSLANRADDAAGGISDAAVNTLQSVHESLLRKHQWMFDESVFQQKWIVEFLHRLYQQNPTCTPELMMTYFSNRQLQAEVLEAAACLGFL